MSLAVTISPPEAAEAGCAVAVNPTAFSYHGANPVNWATATGYGLTPTIPEGAKLLSYDIVMRVTEVDQYSGERTTEDITVTWEDKVLPIELPTAVCDLWSASTQDERDRMPWMFILTKEDIGDRYRYDDRKNRPYGILVETEYEYTGSGMTPLGGPRYQKVETVSVTANFEVELKSHIKFIIRTPNGYTGTHPFDWAEHPLLVDPYNGWNINGTKYPHTQRTVEVEVPRKSTVSVKVLSYAPNSSEGACNLAAGVAYLDYRDDTGVGRLLPALDVLTATRPYTYRFEFVATADSHVFEIWFTVRAKAILTSNIGLFFALAAEEYRRDELWGRYFWHNSAYTPASGPYPLVYEGMMFWQFSVPYYLEEMELGNEAIAPEIIALPERSSAYPIGRAANQIGRFRIAANSTGYNSAKWGDKSAWTFSHWDIAIPNADGTVRHERVTDLTLDWWVPMFGLEFAEPVTLRIQAVYKRPGSILYTPTSGRILHGRSGTILYLD